MHFVTAISITPPNAEITMGTRPVAGGSDHPDENEHRRPAFPQAAHHGHGVQQDQVLPHFRVRGQVAVGFYEQYVTQPKFGVRKHFFLWPF
jgi:hypothetical protein